MLSFPVQPNETRALTSEEYAQITATARHVDPDAYRQMVGLMNAELAEQKAALFAGRAPGVEIKPLPDMDQLDALRFAVEAQTAWLERLERRVAALEAARGA